MHVIVNGESRTFEVGATVADVVRTLEVGPEARGVAVAVDGEVVPRGRWAGTVLLPQSRVEVLGAIGGGR